MSGFPLAESLLMVLEYWQWQADGLFSTLL
jgi:hypothetical protein